MNASILVTRVPRSSQQKLHEYPDVAESDLSHARATAPSSPFCRPPHRLGRLRVPGQGRTMGWGREKDSILSDT